MTLLALPATRFPPDFPALPERLPDQLDQVADGGHSGLGTLDVTCATAPAWSDAFVGRVP